ncbi:ribosome assembly factor SBDS [Candidatus Woesearchaeota archaeon]|nr:ribosome assembly factor SBDS [Candidatus Woesearchaeota archaeon]
MKPSTTFDKERVSFNVARLKKEGTNFEIVITPEKAVSYKEGNDIPIEEIVHSQKIFFDAHKGLLASEERLKSVFSTDEPLQVAKKILEEGEIQLTAEIRSKVREEKKRQLINLIHRNAADPKTGLPHPVQRIELAFEEAKVRVDEYKKADEQVQDVIKTLRPILPINFEKKKLQVLLPAEFAGKAYSTIKNLAEITKDNWLADGSWQGNLELPAGLQSELIDKLNSMTHGNVEIKNIE